MRLNLCESIFLYWIHCFRLIIVSIMHIILYFRVEVDSLCWIDILSLRNVSLPHSFDYVYTFTANNVSSLLTTLIQYSDPSIIDQIPSSSLLVSIPNHLWMNISSISTIVDRFSKMEELKIGDYDFECVKEFYLDGNKNLKLM